jgi:hypothetical protein
VQSARQILAAQVTLYTLRRRKRWAKVVTIVGPVDQRPYKYAVALGIKGRVVAEEVELYEKRRWAEAAAHNYVDK